MIIQVILVLGLLLCLAYAFLQRKKSQLVSVLITIVAVVGIYLVFLPEKANEVAHFVGVGRGADLLFYCWIVISLIVSMNLQFKILKLQGTVIELAREIALQGARLEKSQLHEAREESRIDNI